MPVQPTISTPVPAANETLRAIMWSLEHDSARANRLAFDAKRPARVRTNPPVAAIHASFR